MGFGFRWDTWGSFRVVDSLREWQPCVRVRNAKAVLKMIMASDSKIAIHSIFVFTYYYFLIMPYVVCEMLCVVIEIGLYHCIGVL